MVEKICTAEVSHGNCLAILKGCRDYQVLQEVFTKKELDFYEIQLTEYLYMEEVADTYLYNVPRIVCWYEGIIPTEDFIREYGCQGDCV